MALFESSFFSESLGMCVTVNIVMPQSTLGQIGMKGVGTPDGCPVLYLLHGLSDDHSIWLRRTSVERYAAQYGLALVMPNVHRSFYTNMKNGLRYWDFISYELPEVVGSFFKVSRKREDTFVAGLSMGGYGALKLAFNKPECFAAAGAFSACTDMLTIHQSLPGFEPEYRNIFGSEEEIRGSMNDLFHMVEKAAAEKTVLPQIYMACGTSDFLYQRNLEFKAHLEKNNIPFQWTEGPGSHEWGFWDHYIQEFLKMLPIQRG